MIWKLVQNECFVHQKFVFEKDVVQYIASFIQVQYHMTDHVQPKTKTGSDKGKAGVLRTRPEVIRTSGFQVGGAMVGIKCYGG